MTTSGKATGKTELNLFHHARKSIPSEDARPRGQNGEKVIMISRKSIVDKSLSIKIPDQYALFLDKHGDYEAPGIEVYGLTDDTIDIEKMPCVIGATKIRRREDKLPLRFLVIHHTGLEDEFICLDTENGKIYAMSRVFGNRKIADSFDEWFKRDILPRSRKTKKT
jgi:hypothetical protein